MDALDVEIGELLGDMGDGLAAGCTAEDVQGWVDRTRDLDEDLDRAWALVRQARESARMNPRRSAGALRAPHRWVALLRRLEQALAETRSTAQTLQHGMDEAGDWQSVFREPYVVLLRDVGHAIAAADPGSIRRLRGRLNDLVDRIGDERARRAALAGLRRADHQPAQHPGRDGRGRGRQPDAPAAAPVPPARL